MVSSRNFGIGHSFGGSKFFCPDYHAKSVAIMNMFFRRRFILSVLYPLSFVFLCMAFLSTCRYGGSEERYLTDSTNIKIGEKIFREQCSGCHNFRQNGIGPNLSGITDSVPASWLNTFIHNPAMMVEKKDGRAAILFARYKTIMPSFDHLGDTSISQVMAYINTQKRIEKAGAKTAGLADPIPDEIAFSDIVLDLELMVQIPPSSDKLPLTRITQLYDQPQFNRKLVLDLRGKIFAIENNMPRLFMDMSALKPGFINQPGLATGFGSICFHPGFSLNGLLYTTHTELPSAGKADFSYSDSIKSLVQWVITEWKMKDPAAGVFAGESRELFRINMPTGIHGVQEITFNPLAKKGDKDYGLLYIGIGDGGSAEVGYPFLVNASNGVWGTIFRIDPSGRNSSNGKYGIPAANPFVGHPEIKSHPEIFSYGFRNPHRLTWLRDGRLLATNIGNTHIEAVYDVSAGANCGWPAREGSFVIDTQKDMDAIFPLPPDDSNFHINYPVIEYDHDEGNAIAGGYEYTGDLLPELKGKFCFADITSGRVFFVPVTDIKKGQRAAIREFHLSLDGHPVTLAQLCGVARVEMRLARDTNGELYVMTKPDGKLYRIKSAAVKKS
jgi:glucose/arabinose dehydrogenase